VRSLNFDSAFYFTNIFFLYLVRNAAAATTTMLTTNLILLQGELKMELFLSVDSLSTVSDRKVLDMSKVSEFCLVETSDLLTQTETRSSRSACLKHSKTKSKSFTRRRQAPDDPRL